MTPRPFPNPTAIFNDRFIFTTLWPAEVASHNKSPYCHPDTGKPCHLFTLDEDMRYTPFAMDHGPLNLAFTFQACIDISTWLTQEDYQNDTICLYTSPEPTTKSNMALMVSLYFLIVRHHSPSEVFQPIARMEVMPFRDAGNGVMDHGLSIQDCLYGVDLAIKCKLLSLHDFDPVPYRFYEQVNNGDLNILGPFIAFASPTETYWIKSMQISIKAITPTSGTHQSITTSFAKGRAVTKAFKNVLQYFRQQYVGVVVRLNDELYDRRHFLDIGIDHVEMYFDDGTNPTDEIVRDFIALAEEYIERRNLRVAVHCKAGLGRTGVLIGAYLIYKYSFSAQEVIGYMRIVRPGMVVGPQQQYMMANQMKWVGWAARDQALRELQAALPREAPNPLATPPHEDLPLLPLQQRSPNYSARETVNQLEHRKSPPRAASRSPTPISTYRLPASTKGGDAAGQPRKSPTRSSLRAVEVIQSVDIIIAPPSPGPTPSDIVTETLIHHHSSPPPSPISPMDSSFSLSIRGTKRGLSRTPNQSSSTDSISGSALAYSALKVSSELQRSVSSVSMTSTEERPSKRRTAQTPSSSLSRTGLSSPPPSRESSPMVEARNMEEDKDVATPLPIRTPNKLQRPRPISIVKVERPAPPPTTKNHATDKTETKSFLPRRVPPPSPTKDIRYHRQETPSDTPARTPLKSVASPQTVPDRTPLKASASPQTKLPVPVKRESRRMMLTPPRFRGMLAKIGGSSPSS